MHNRCSYFIDCKANISRNKAISIIARKAATLFYPQALMVTMTLVAGTSSGVVVVRWFRLRPADMGSLL